MHDLNSDIEKYLNGELSPAEMHALEKKALDDPFLADALEGGGSLDTHAFSEDMQHLHASLDERVSPKKGMVIPLWGWTARIAAGLLLLVVASYIVMRLTRDDDQPEQLAQNNKQETIPAPVVADSSAAGNGEAKTDSVSLRDQQYLSRAETSSPAKSSRNKPQLRNADKSSGVAASEPVVAPSLQAAETERVRGDVFGENVMDSLRIASAAIKQDTNSLAFYKAAETKDERVAETKVVIRGYATVNEDVESDDDSDKSEKKSRKAAKKKDAIISPSEISERAKGLSVTNTLDANQKNIVRGRVTASEDGEGLPGVNVVIKGTEIGTITDADGNYEIHLPQPAVTLTYSFIGLESVEHSAAADSFVNVALNEDVSQLSEVVITGYGEGEGSDGELATFDMAAPAGGKKAFKKYLEEKIQYPQIALENKVEGKVTVQFVVDTYGKLVDFKVVKGIGYGCDEEVIRLIRQGPAWTPMKRNEEPIRGRVRVRMRFSLPENKK